ncbi:MAG: hypothetical protein P8103_17340 [Candidatus Thiodiazotropha sp.]
MDIQESIFEQEAETIGRYLRCGGRTLANRLASHSIAIQTTKMAGSIAETHMQGRLSGGAHASTLKVICSFYSGSLRHKLLNIFMNRLSGLEGRDEGGPADDPLAE